MDIKKRRMELNMRQADLAIKCGVSERTIQTWERGTGKPSPENMKKLMLTLGMKHN